MHYNITVSNPTLGTTLDNTHVTLIVPIGVSFHRVNGSIPNSSSSCFNNLCAAGSEVLWNLGTLAPGDSQTITVEANVAADVSPGSLITTQVTVTATDLGDSVNLQRSVGVIAP